MNKPILTVVALTTALSAATAAHAMDDMKGMDMGQKQSPASAAKTHHAKGVVKKADPATGQVTFAHEAVKTLNWPAMTMDFQVRDKALFDKLKAGKTVEFDFEKGSAGYVVTAVK